MPIDDVAAVTLNHASRNRQRDRSRDGTRVDIGQFRNFPHAQRACVVGRLVRRIADRAQYRQLC